VSDSDTFDYNCIITLKMAGLQAETCWSEYHKQIKIHHKIKVHLLVVHTFYKWWILFLSSPF